VAIVAFPASTAAVPHPAPAAQPARTAAAAPAPATPARSGLPWASGLFAHDAGRALAFEQMRSAPVDLLSVHPGRDSWASAMHPWWLTLTEPLRRQPGVRLEVSLPPFLPDKGVGQPQGQQWRQWGTQLVARGEPDAIVNLGKEMTLPNPWACTPANVAQWIARFREAVTALRSVPGQRFTIAWTVNEGHGQTGIQPEQCYPGDAYVDVVGVDYYDQWEPIRTPAQRDARFARRWGLDHWLGFARAHGKRLALPEWGVSSGTQWAGHAGGDNPFYVVSVLGWLSANRGHIAYESYFEEPAPFVASGLLEPTRNDAARAAYQREIARLR
jgi:hypothetical protein